MSPLEVRPRALQHAPGRLALVALALLPAAASAVAGPQAAAPVDAVAPARVARAVADLDRQRAALGLSAEAGFAVRSAVSAPGGEALLRLRQTHLGARVFGGEVTARVSAGGATRVVASGLQPGIALTGGPAITEAQAVAAALRALAPRGPLASAPRAELVVFPTRFQGGLAIGYDPATGRTRLDRERTVAPRAITAPYVWAYEVKTFLRNPQDGHREQTYVVDGATGAILRAWSQVRHQAIVEPELALGHSQYSGAVQVPGSRDVTDPLAVTHALQDPTRGTLPNAWLVEQALPSPFFPPWTGPVSGLQTITQDYTTGALVGYGGRAAAEWGDGQVFVGTLDTHGSPILFDWTLTGAELTVNGETAAVDAQFGLALTWDLYRNIFGREGIDGLGTSPFALVHALSPFGMPFDNAFWSDSLFGMVFGDGTFTYFGAPGFLSLTEVDITGHEMSHGVCATTADLIYEGESGGLNESNSDIFGELVEAYSKRAAGADAVIPEGNDWQIGRLVGQGAPLRWMHRPSLDGLSADAWYAGVEFLDVHYSSGPMNRAFFHLSQGAPADATAEAWSPYLPGGMTGIGNDAAGRIWFKTLTEHLLADATYASAREGAIAAATDLYGAGSAQVGAVQRAFAAINVGEAPGQAPRVRVALPVVHADGVLSARPRTQVFPVLTAVRPQAEVTGSTAGVTWIPHGIFPFHDGGGLIGADGAWTTPSYNGFAFLTAVSKADPLQYAVANVYLVMLDADGDLVQDAVDMGEAALSWGLAAPLRAAHGIQGGFEPVDDIEVALFQEALRNAYPVSK